MRDGTPGHEVVKNACGNVLIDYSEILNDDIHLP
jgi:hypothetical protein